MLHGNIQWKIWGDVLNNGAWIGINQVSGDEKIMAIMFTEEL